MRDSTAVFFCSACNEMYSEADRGLSPDLCVDCDAERFHAFDYLEPVEIIPGDTRLN